MRKILKLNLITLITIFSLSFLFCGIVEINDRTSYITTGIRQETIKAQNLKGKNVPMIEEDDNPFVNDKIKSIIKVAKHCSVPPTGCVVSILEKNFGQ